MMLYLIRCCNGTSLAFTMAGALAMLRVAGPDARVYSIFGRFLRGREQPVVA
jgi:hypothetical protein